MSGHRSSKKDPEVADDESVEEAQEEEAEEEEVEEEEEAKEEEAKKKSTKKKMSTTGEQAVKQEMTDEEKAAAKKAALEKAAEEKKTQLADAIESISKAGVPHKVSSVISAVWLDDTKTYVTAALLGRPIETSIKAVTRMKHVPDEKRIERLAMLYSRVAGLEEKLIRARLDVVHIEHARIAMAYPETTLRKRKAPTGFIAGETTKPVEEDDDDECGCNDADLEEEEEAPQKKRKPDASKARGAAEPPKKKKKTAAKCEPEDD